jgi:hypothetical protein
MSSPTDAPTQPGTEQRGDRPGTVAHGRRRRVLWVLAGVFAAATFAFWAWALFLYDPGLLIDELGDRTFPTQAEEVCATTMVQLDALPRAEETTDAIERADVIDTANGYLTAMVADLRPLAPTSPSGEAEAVAEWLDDWEVHIEDRREYAKALRSDPAAPFVEETKGAKQLSRAIDGYAQVNRMRSCETPGDV